MTVPPNHRWHIARTFPVPDAGEALAWDKPAKAWKPFVPAQEVADAALEQLRIISWNVWFNDETNRTLRHRALTKLCFVSEEAEADVVCLQEMTARQIAAYDELLGITPIANDDPLASRAKRILDTLRKEWIITPFVPHSLIHTRNIYFGTVIFIRRSLVERLGASISLGVEALPSQCDRVLHTLTLLRDDRPLLRLGTTQLDGAPIAVELRKEQLRVCAAHLLSAGPSVPAVLTGDFNNVLHSEVETILSPPYAFQDGMVSFDTRPTYNTTYVLKGANTQRIDFVLLSSPGFEILEGKVLGEEPVKLPKGMEKPKRVAPNGKVYPSDHVGVRVTARWSPSPSQL